MKEIIGFLGRIFFVYGIPIIAFVVASENDAMSGGVIIGAVVWMFIFHFITKNWEDWGNN